MEIPGFGSFTDEQVELFQRRYEKDTIFFSDLSYVNWLERHHPEAVPSDRYNLVSTEDCDLSVANHFVNVSPLCPTNTAHSTPGATPRSSPGFETLNSANKAVSSRLFVFTRYECSVKVCSN